MQTHFVLATVDVYCERNGETPTYRLYVNGELFAERTWIWDGFYLEENIQLSAPFGNYKIDVFLIDSKEAKLTVKNLNISEGQAIKISDNELMIVEEHEIQRNL